MQQKDQLMRDIDFGQGTAERDRLLLDSFVETDLWSDMFQDRVDIVYGPKGSGKSAIYTLLLNKQRELRQRGILVIGAENLHDDPVFQALPANIELSDELFVGLWKLYFLALIGYHLREARIRDQYAQKVIALLEEEELIPKHEHISILSQIFHASLRYVDVTFRVGAPIIHGSITLHEPTPTQKEQGKLSLNYLFAMTGKSLEQARLKLWIAIDRLDVAFASDEVIETAALRALFRTYNDLRVPAYRMALKIFLRNDIWNRISATGQRFVEASAIQGKTIEWNGTTLMNLIVKRILQNKTIVSSYKINSKKVQGDFRLQQSLFYQLFPERMNLGNADISSFDWILHHIRDGSGQVAPRELILLLSFARDAQLRRNSVGLAHLIGDQLFEYESIEIAAVQVSEFRLHRTLYAEYPHLRESIELFRGREHAYTLEDLARIWNTTRDDASYQATILAHLGFFVRAQHEQHEIWHIPPLYQNALAIYEKTL